MDSNEAQKFINSTKLIAMDIINDNELADEDKLKQLRLNNNLLPNSPYKEYMRDKIKTPINFHFNTGKYTLDHDVNKDILELKDLIKTHGYEDATIALIGFSDSSIGKDNRLHGDNQTQINLSLKRANYVKQKLLNNGFTNIETKGFGAQKHLLFEYGADNEAERYIDRRVEVWLKPN